MDTQNLIIPGLLLLAILATWIYTRREITRLAERIAGIEGALSARLSRPAPHPANSLRSRPKIGHCGPLKLDQAGGSPF